MLQSRTASTRGIVAFLALWMALGPHVVQASPPLSTFTLQLRDLRPGYVVVTSRPRTASSIASAAQLSVRQLIRRGWISGYQVLYHRQLAPSIEVGGYVDSFRGRVGASWWYNVNLKHIPASYHTISFPVVGDQSTALQGNPGTGFVAVIFRQGSYVGEVYVSMQVVAPQSSALVLARRVDLRMQQASSSTSVPWTTVPSPTLSVRAWMSPNPVPYGAHPILYVKTTPGAGCSSSVVFSTGQVPSSFHGYVQVVPQSGVVSWPWHVETRQRRGVAHVTCTFAGVSKSSDAIFSIY